VKSRLHKATKPSVHAGFQRYVETADGSSETGRYCAQSLLTSWMVVALMVSCSLIACAQTPADDKNAPPPLPKPEIQSLEVSLPPVRLKSLPRNLFMDQETFWSTPFHMTKAEWEWTVPLVFAGTALVASDTAIEKHAPTSPATVSHAATASNAGLAAMAAAGGGMFVWGHLAHND